MKSALLHFLDYIVDIDAMDRRNVADARDPFFALLSTIQYSPPGLSALNTASLSVLVLNPIPITS